MQDLGTLPATCAASSVAYGINELGHVAGSSELGNCNPGHAFFWTPEDGMRDIGDFPGGVNNSVANAINIFDHIAGYGGSNTGDRGFFWSVQTGMINLGDLPGGQDVSYAMDINDDDYIIGWSCATYCEAVFWTAERVMVPFSAWFDEPGGESNAINNLGQVAGSFNTQAAIWDIPRHRRTLLGLLGGRCPYTWLTSANDINDLGQVVGYSICNNDGAGFIWDGKHGMKDLNELLDPCIQHTHVDGARSINNHGQIIAGGRALGISGVGFLLTPYLPGDLDEDRDVDLFDLTRMLANFGRDGGATYADGDIEGCDGDVDLRDLTTLLSNFGETLPP